MGDLVQLPVDLSKKNFILLLKIYSGDCPFKKKMFGGTKSGHLLDFENYLEGKHKYLCREFLKEMIKLGILKQNGTRKRKNGMIDNVYIVDDRKCYQLIEKQLLFNEFFKSIDKQTIFNMFFK